MTAAAAGGGNLDPKVGDALLDDQEVMNIMEHPKLVAAIAKLKEDQSQYFNLVAADPELKDLFELLNQKMSAKEGSMAKQAEEVKERKITMDSPAPISSAYDVPPLEDATKLECDSARAEGTVAFEAGDFETAASKYERAAVLEPHHAPHWTNLSVARLRCGDAEAAKAAAREATRRNPRFAKAWLRLGEALTELGECTEAVEVFESGLKRAEGAIRIAMTKGLQKAKAAAPPKPKPFSGEDASAKGDGKGANSLLDGGMPASAEEAMARVHGMMGGGEAAAEKKAPKALPTWEEEKALAAETEALRKRTEDQMKKYAEMAKQQTRSAATRPAPAPAPAASAVAPAGRRVLVTDDDDDDDDEPRIVEIEAAPALSGTAEPAVPAAAPGRRVIIAEEDDDDDDEPTEGPVPVLGPAPPPPAPALSPTSATDAVADGSDPAESALGAALAQWSLNKPRSPTKPKEVESDAGAEPAKAAVLPAPPKFPALSNDLIFDLA